MTDYKEILERGKNDACIIDGKCSLCGIQMAPEEAYYTRREHFERVHGMSVEAARYSALYKPDESIDDSAMNWWLKNCVQPKES